MSEDRIITFPMQAVEDIANRLCDRDWDLPMREAEEIARDIVIDVTLAVDKLRASEALADELRVDRAVHALSRFVFPGAVVPRSEMARAVLDAADNPDGYEARLPPKSTVWPPASHLRSVGPPTQTKGLGQ